MVDNSGFVVKHDGGVPLAARTGATSAFGVAAGDGQAYIVRTGTTGGTDVYLVNQPTVESAINATKNVRPRASTSMNAAGSTAAGAAAAADGNLWLLVGSATDGGTRTIRELSVPADSSAGAALTASDHGSVPGPAAVGTATTGRNGSGPTVVAVAGGNRLRLFAPGAGPRTLRYPAPAGVDAVLPAAGGQGSVAFLLHGTAGWSIVSAGADGSRDCAAKPLAGLPPDARLAPPGRQPGRAVHGRTAAPAPSTGSGSTAGCTTFPVRLRIP